MRFVEPAGFEPATSMLVCHSALPAELRLHETHDAKNKTAIDSLIAIDLARAIERDERKNSAWKSLLRMRHEGRERTGTIRTVIVAATYSPHLVVSTIGATAFYFRVRNGTG